MDKAQEVNELLRVLCKDCDDGHLAAKERLLLLTRLKILGREADGCDALYTRHGIKTLARQAFQSPAPEASREALRSIANALLLRPSTRQIFFEAGHAEELAERSKRNYVCEEFLYSRILLLLTYNASIDFVHLVEQHQLAASINTCLACHVKHAKAHCDEEQGRSLVDVMALSETLKLIFNLTHLWPELSAHFTASISHIVDLLSMLTPWSGLPLDPPINHLVNSLLSLDLGKDTSRSIFPVVNPNGTVRVLIDILGSSVAQYAETALDAAASPLLTLIRRIHEDAPDTVKAFMRQQLLPSLDERSLPLGQSQSLPAQLLRLSTSAYTPTLHDFIPSLMFELSDKGPSQLVKNVGYGFASGYLARHNMPLSTSEALEHSTTVNSTDDSNVAREVNFVTGQYLTDEPEEAMPEMTEDEKLREAEKLFVLFERLEATGVLSVQNPVRMSNQSGEF